MTLVANLPPLRATKPSMIQSLLKRTPPEGSGRSLFEYDALQAEVFKALDDPLVRQVSLKIGSQLGKSEIILSAIAHFMEYSAGTIFVALPGLLTRDRFVVEKLKPMLKANKDLYERIHWGRNETLPRDLITFDGGPSDLCLLPV